MVGFRVLLLRLLEVALRTKHLSESIRALGLIDPTVDDILPQNMSTTANTSKASPGSERIHIRSTRTSSDPLTSVDAR